MGRYYQNLIFRPYTYMLSQLFKTSDRSGGMESDPEASYEAIACDHFIS
jgi:hypothetical protein